MVAQQSREPPLQRHSVCSLIPHVGPTPPPSIAISACFPIAAICSSENRFRFSRQGEPLISQTLIFSASGDGVISADQVLPRHAFINVIHNAMKYSPAGGTIEVQACAIAPMSGNQRR
jgi:signal transduction histidine kinase